ncbi:DUF5304 domain-containing protein [Streptomyces xinghaiensis]|uniref:DUF5304 domain-containing protein n=1 Tax=Streptomyces xinghaiensis TaxID=1038928 RepID=UPI000BB016C9|nr:DUF5304 domain-containing protein [Streptomyces xinghaiensis]
MSDPTEHPATEPAGTPATGAAPAADADAWSTACAEDLAAEKARRRAQEGRPPGSAAEELLKLADAVADRLSSLQLPVAGLAAQSAVQQLVNRAKAAVEPVVERNPDVFDHLAAAGSELLAAYRSAVERQESDWTRGTADPGRRGADGESGEGPEDPGGPSGSGRIDLD